MGDLHRFRIAFDGAAYFQASIDCHDFATLASLPPNHLDPSHTISSLISLGSLDLVAPAHCWRVRA